jgi:hypothetical protein
MQELVRNDEVLEPRFLVSQVVRKSDDTARRAGSPFARHALHANDSRFDLESRRPVRDSLTKLPAPVVT